MDILHYDIIDLFNLLMYAIATSCYITTVGVLDLILEPE